MFYSPGVNIHIANKQGELLCSNQERDEVMFKSWGDIEKCGGSGLVIYGDEATALNDISGLNQRLKLTGLRTIASLYELTMQ
jgi:hypothetical protein